MVVSHNFNPKLGDASNVSFGWEQLLILRWLCATFLHSLP